MENKGVNARHGPTDVRTSGGSGSAARRGRRHGHSGSTAVNAAHCDAAVERTHKNAGPVNMNPRSLAHYIVD